MKAQEMIVFIATLLLNYLPIIPNPPDWEAFTQSEATSGRWCEPG
jgi:hypothetical protein